MATDQGLARGYQLVIFDLDGVVYLGSDPIDGAAEAIQATVDGGTPVAFVTNNASRRAAEVAALLRSMRVPAGDDEVLTAAQAAAEGLAGELSAGSAVLVVGAPALRDEISAVGLTPVDRVEDRPVAVVQGYGPEVGWAQLAEACLAIRAGARWVATNTDATMPSPRGPLPGNGSLVAALSTALGGRVPDLVVGKPEPELFRLAARHRGAGTVLVVGDRLDTDIDGARRAGLDSLLVLTGVSTPADLLTAVEPHRPTFVAADCRGLSTVADQLRIPLWDGEKSEAGGWRVGFDGSRLRLGGGAAGDPDARVAALRAVAAAVWAHPTGTGIAADGADAAAVLSALALDRFPSQS